MRISENHIRQIKSTAQNIFGKDCEIYLFGSRVKDQAKGGDIDLLIQTNDLQDMLSKKLTFLSRVKTLIGDQKIDLIIRPFTHPSSQDTIYLEALKGQVL